MVGRCSLSRLIAETRNPVGRLLGRLNRAHFATGQPGKSVLIEMQIRCQDF